MNRQIGTHVIEFHDSDAFFAQSVSQRVARTLGEGSAMIVVATPRHAVILRGALAGAGIDVDAASAEGRFVTLDVETLLDGLMMDDRLDARRFTSMATQLLEQLIEVGRDIVVHTEMSAVLCARGRYQDAITLEMLWGEVAAVSRSTVVCSYAVDAFDQGRSVESFQHLCQLHSHVVRCDSGGAPSLLVGALLNQAEAAVTDRARFTGNLSELRSQIEHVRHRLDTPGRLDGWAIANLRADLASFLAAIDDPGAITTEVPMLVESTGWERPGSRG